MKVIIFVSILFSIFVRINAPFPGLRSELLGNYPNSENFNLNTLPLRSNPSPPFSSIFESPIRDSRVPLNPDLEDLRRRLETIRGRFAPILSTLRSEPVRRPSTFSFTSFPELSEFPPSAQIGNSSIRPEPPKEVSKDEESKPPKDDETNDDSKNPKQPQQTPPSESSPDESSKNESGKEEWEGPKTPEEDKPELYTVDENVRFVRSFSSDMTKLGKYKIAETIYYLLTKKQNELDEADRAAIDYVINERLKKDPEIIEALRIYNEKHKGEDTTEPSTFNNAPIPDEEMPPSMFRMLTSSNYSSQFRSPSRNENDQNSPSNFGRSFSGNRPIFDTNRRTPLNIRQEGSLPRFSNFPMLSIAEDFPNYDRNRRTGRIFQVSPWPIRQFPPPFDRRPPMLTPILPPALLARRWPVLQLPPRRWW